MERASKSVDADLSAGQPNVRPWQIMLCDVTITLEDGPMERRLSAIMVADMVGYSRLMEADEAGTIRRQKDHRRKLFDPRFSEFGGRIIKTTGDGLLAEFSSIVGAVQCAVAIQREMANREAGEPEERRIRYRIGINLGDVVHQDGDLLGDGVNVAARMEQMAEPGGICISGTAYDQLRSTVEAGYQDLGEVRVKNISRPIRAFRVLLDPAQAGRVIAAPWVRSKTPIWAGTVALVLGALAGGYWWSQQTDPAHSASAACSYLAPEQPSVAVLPFDNLSGEAGQDHLADGLTESITSILATHPNISVAARNSSFTYKGKASNIQAIAKDLGVRYVLEGSVQQAGETLRVSAQLIDSQSGHHVWSEQYDEDLSSGGALKVQDEITRNIYAELNSVLIAGKGRAEGAYKSAGGDLKTYRLLVEADNEFVKFTADSNARAEELALLALERDPGSTFALTMLAWTNWLKATFGLTNDPVATLAAGRDFADRALKVDSAFANAHMVRAWIDLRQSKYDAAVQGAKTALELDRGDGRMNALAAWVYAASGSPELGIQYFSDAFRLEPYAPRWVPSTYSLTLLMAERNDEARCVAEAILVRTWDDGAHFTLAYLDMKAGKTASARRHIKENLARFPVFSVAGRRYVFGYIRDQAFFEDYLAILGAAGLPERPPAKPATGN